MVPCNTRHHDIDRFINILMNLIIDKIINFKGYYLIHYFLLHFIPHHLHLPIITHSRATLQKPNQNQNHSYPTPSTTIIITYYHFHDEQATQTPHSQKKLNPIV